MSPLHYIGEFFRDLLLQIPLPAARGLFLLWLVALLVWVMTRPRDQVIDTTGSHYRPSENLKLWAAAALVIQILIYLVL